MLSAPGVDGLGGVAAALAAWQRDGAPVQLHPGDLGWYWRFGAAQTGAAVRTWVRDGRTLAVGLLDEPGLLRLAVAPSAADDERLAREVLGDVTQPERGVLPRGDAAIEARPGWLLRDLLHAAGWADGELRAPLVRDLGDAVQVGGAGTVVVGPELAAERVAVQLAAFERSSFTLERWHTMAAGPVYADGRCFLRLDDHGEAVAAATVWSAGPGRPGLLEPMGVHREHRRHGHGRAMTLAAAAALRELGSSSMIVCTASANVAAVATYRAAGFTAQPDVPDLRRS